MIIESSAPTRVDLAGGTIDIWPIYLFHPNATTVNFALSLRAQVRIEPRDEKLELVSKMVHFFRPGTGFHLVTNSEAPAGAGISGSSALAIALIGSLNRLVGNRLDSRKF